MQKMVFQKQKAVSTQSIIFYRMEDRSGEVKL